MEVSTLIRKIHMECPLCDKIHEIEEHKHDRSGAKMPQARSNRLS